MQRRAAIWILKSFKTSSLDGIEAIAGLIPIKLHLQKLVGRLQLRTLLLLSNHLIQTFIDSSFSFPKHRYSVLLNSLTSYQRSHVKGYLVDFVNKSYKIFSSFFPLHLELSSGFRIIDNFSD